MDWAQAQALKLLEPKSPSDAKYAAVLLAKIIRLERQLHTLTSHEGELYEHEDCKVP